MNDKDLQERYVETLKEYSSIDKRLALMEQSLKILKDNHLFHLEADVRNINKKFNWAVGCVFVQMLGIISVLVLNM